MKNWYKNWAFSNVNLIFDFCQISSALCYVVLDKNTKTFIFIKTHKKEHIVQMASQSSSRKKVVLFDREILPKAQ